MNILDKIIAFKKEEVEKLARQVSLKELEQSSLIHRSVISLRKALRTTGNSGIIAEFKRKSPSKGIINADVTVEEVTMGYVHAGASALSILTDSGFFGGTVEDLKTARRNNGCPILRKDFIISEYQIVEAKSIGADVILLIAAALSKSQTKNLAAFAASLKLEVLLEIHNEKELGHICEGVHAVGVNNRNLSDFTVDVQRSFDLIDKIPSEFLRISESGLNLPETIVDLKNAGFNGFLIGENFMKTKNPGESCRQFISRIDALSHPNQ